MSGCIWSLHPAPTRGGGPSGEIEHLCSMENQRSGLNDVGVNERVTPGNTAAAAAASSFFRRFLSRFDQHHSSNQAAGGLSVAVIRTEGNQGSGTSPSHGGEKGVSQICDGPDYACDMIGEVLPCLG